MAIPGSGTVRDPYRVSTKAHVQELFQTKAYDEFNAGKMTYAVLVNNIGTQSSPTTIRFTKGATNALYGLVLDGQGFELHLSVSRYQDARQINFIMSITRTYITFNENWPLGFIWNVASNNRYTASSTDVIVEMNLYKQSSTATGNLRWYPKTGIMVNPTIANRVGYLNPRSSEKAPFFYAWSRYDDPNDANQKDIGAKHATVLPPADRQTAKKYVGLNRNRNWGDTLGAMRLLKNNELSAPLWDPYKAFAIRDAADFKTWIEQVAPRGLAVGILFGDIAISPVTDIFIQSSTGGRNLGGMASMLYGQGHFVSGGVYQPTDTKDLNGSRVFSQIKARNVKWLLSTKVTPWQGQSTLFSRADLKHCQISVIGSTGVDALTGHQISATSHRIEDCLFTHNRVGKTLKITTDNQVPNFKVCYFEAIGTGATWQTNGDGTQAWAPLKFEYVNDFSGDKYDPSKYALSVFNWTLKAATRPQLGGTGLLPANAKYDAAITALSPVARYPLHSDLKPTVGSGDAQGARLQFHKQPVSDFGASTQIEWNWGELSITSNLSGLRAVTFWADFSGLATISTNDDILAGICQIISSASGGEGSVGLVMQDLRLEKYFRPAILHAAANNVDVYQRVELPQILTLSLYPVFFCITETPKGVKVIAKQVKGKTVIWELDGAKFPASAKAVTFGRGYNGDQKVLNGSMAYRVQDVALFNKRLTEDEFLNLYYSSDIEPPVQLNAIKGKLTAEGSPAKLKVAATPLLTHDLGVTTTADAAGDFGVSPKALEPTLLLVHPDYGREVKGGEDVATGEIIRPSTPCEVLYEVTSGGTLPEYDKIPWVGEVGKEITFGINNKVTLKCLNKYDPTCVGFMKLGEAELPTGQFYPVDIKGAERISETDSGDSNGTILHPPSGMPDNGLWLVYMASQEQLPDAYMGFTKVDEVKIPKGAGATDPTEDQYGAWFWRQADSDVGQVVVRSKKKIASYGIGLANAFIKGITTAKLNDALQPLANSKVTLPALSHAEGDVLAFGADRTEAYGRASPSTAVTITPNKPTGVPELFDLVNADTTKRLVGMAIKAPKNWDGSFEFTPSGAVASNQAKNHQQGMVIKVPSQALTMADSKVEAFGGRGSDKFSNDPYAYKPVGAKVGDLWLVHWTQIREGTPQALLDAGFKPLTYMGYGVAPWPTQNAPSTLFSGWVWKKIEAADVDVRVTGLTITIVSLGVRGADAALVESRQSDWVDTGSGNDQEAEISYPFKPDSNALYLLAGVSYHYIQYSPPNAIKPVIPNTTDYRVLHSETTSSRRRVRVMAMRGDLSTDGNFKIEGRLQSASRRGLTLDVIKFIPKQVFIKPPLPWKGFYTMAISASNTVLKNYKDVQGVASDMGSGRMLFGNEAAGLLAIGTKTDKLYEYSLSGGGFVEKSSGHSWDIHGGYNQCTSSPYSFIGAGSVKVTYSVDNGTTWVSTNDPLGKSPKAAYVNADQAKAGRADCAG